MKIIDCHVHYALPLEQDKILETMKRTGTDCFNIVLVPDRQHVSNLPEALVLKHMAGKGNAYLFASLDVSKYYTCGKKLGTAFAKYTKKVLNLGADGIKMIEGKPTMKKVIPLPDFDSSVWEPFFDYCEKNNVPILWHVNDPEEFWDKEKVPSYLKKTNFYYDETYPNNTKVYEQVFNVLKNHPNISIIFAHFFFLSKNLDKLQEIFDKYPNVKVDLTPGIEMYLNFNLNIKQAKEFFIKNQDRIIYGTDIGARAILAKKPINDDESNERVQVVRDFLEKKTFTIYAKGNFYLGEKDIKEKGINLDKPVLEKIYHKNFENTVGLPRKILKNKVIAECKNIKKTIFMMSIFDIKLIRDYSSANKAIEYFKKQK